MGTKKHTVDHLTKIPIGSSVSQIAISETSRKRPISHERPPKPDIKGWVAYGTTGGSTVLLLTNLLR